MPRSFNLPALAAKIPVKDPRLVMRSVIGLLLAANLVAAVFAFHPFGGGADDLRREQAELTSRLSQLQKHLKASQDLVGKVQIARTQGDDFMNRYFMSSQQMAFQMVAEFVKSAQDAGVKVGTESFAQEEIEGSATLHMLSTQVNLEGSYSNLTKFVNLLDKSQRFLIIESMQASAPQQQQQQQQPGSGQPVHGQPVSTEQNLTVTMKVDAFVKDVPGAAL